MMIRTVVFEPDGWAAHIVPIVWAGFGLWLQANVEFYEVEATNRDDQQGN